MNGAAVLCAHSKNYSTVHDVGEFAGTSGDFYENSVEKGLGCATPQPMVSFPSFPVEASVYYGVRANALWVVCGA